MFKMMELNNDYHKIGTVAYLQQELWSVIEAISSIKHSEWEITDPVQYHRY